MGAERPRKSFYNHLSVWLVGVEAVTGGERLHGPTIWGWQSVCRYGDAGCTGGDAVSQSMWPGFVLLQIGIIGWTLGSIYQRKQISRSHPIVIAGVQQLAAGLIYIPVTFLVPHHSAVWTTRVTLAVVYLVIFGSLVGYSAYVVAMDRLPVSRGFDYPYVNAVVAVWLGWAFYRERFGLREFLSMLVIFAGVAIVKWQSAEQHAPTLVPKR